VRQNLPMSWERENSSVWQVNGLKYAGKSVHGWQQRCHRLWKSREEEGVSFWMTLVSDPRHN
jgi:hypothetical protein